MVHIPNNHAMRCTGVIGEEQAEAQRRTERGAHPHVLLFTHAYLHTLIHSLTHGEVASSHRLPRVVAGTCGLVRISHIHTPHVPLYPRLTNMYICMYAYTSPCECESTTAAAHTTHTAAIARSSSVIVKRMRTHSLTDRRCPHLPINAVHTMSTHTVVAHTVAHSAFTERSGCSCCSHCRLCRC